MDPNPAGVKRPGSEGGTDSLASDPARDILVGLEHLDGGIP